jgi:hypothetical protein
MFSEEGGVKPPHSKAGSARIRQRIADPLTQAAPAGESAGSTRRPQAQSAPGGLWSP